MAGVGGPEHPAAPVQVLPAVSDDGQSSHTGGAGVPAGGCGEGVSFLCLYGKLLTRFTPTYICRWIKQCLLKKEKIK